MFGFVNSSIKKIRLHTMDVDWWWDYLVLKQNIDNKEIQNFTKPGADPINPMAN